MTDIEVLEKVENLIYEVRGQQVMLDSDVARLYGYETKAINQTVKRNIERFPERYCFQLTEAELQTMRSQIVTAYPTEASRSQFATLNEKSDNRSQFATASKRNERFLPYVFTEHGITMLAGLLKSDQAVKESLRIIDAFVAMRRFMFNNESILRKLYNQDLKLIEHDNKIEKLFKKTENETFKKKVFYSGQIYDAYSLLIKIINEADHEIIIVDNYIDNKILDILCYKKENVKIKIITNKVKNHLDLSKFKEQYPNIKLGYKNDIHDRFIIIDEKVLYHIGASLKDLGKKVFAINRLEDKSYLNKIIKELGK